MTSSMILDDSLVITSANFTPTQFAFGRRKMEMSIDGEKTIKEDNFSEVNGFVIIENPPADVLSTLRSLYRSMGGRARSTHQIMTTTNL